jgi:hypothetical protein
MSADIREPAVLLPHTNIYTLEIPPDYFNFETIAISTANRY